MYRRRMVIALSVAIAGNVVATVHAQATRSAGVVAQLESAAKLPGEPTQISAAGVTRTEQRLVTIENPSPFDDGSPLRLVIVAGLDGDDRSASAAIEAVKWFKSSAPQSIRRAWTLSALPLANPEDRPPQSTRMFVFPPDKGFFDDKEGSEARYVWRWVTYQAPDLVLEIRGGDKRSWQSRGLPAASQGQLQKSSLAAAISGDSALPEGTTPAVLATVSSATDGPAIVQQVLKAATGLARSPLRTKLLARAARKPLQLAQLLAGRYPEMPIVSYIPSVSWMSRLRLADATGDTSIRDAVVREVQPWLSRERPLFGDRIALTAAGGTMIYAELSARGNASATPLAVEGAEAASEMLPTGIARYGQGWTDDMFMASSILSRSGKLPGRTADLDRIASMLISYASRLQREDGIFVHFTDGRQAWGRGNGFAALGVTEALTSLPASHPMREQLMSIYKRHMNAMRLMQAPDGMWRQVVDEPGAYREESVTAMTLTAMARGVRLGWLDSSFQPVIDRAWRGLAAHITEEGDIVDICTGTGAGPTKRYYLDRAAISGRDDRGGAMAMQASMEMYTLKP